MAYRNSERLTTLLNDILDRERIESSQIAFDFQPVDLRSLAHIAVDDNEGYAQAQGVRLVVESGVAQAPVSGDAQRLLQVFANLLSNGTLHPQGPLGLRP
jgi:signal transduction histidine kinase